MIAVIADDFTGAAEISGLALSYGYKVAIVTKFKRIPDVDILVVATDMRSIDPVSAAKESERITKKLLEINPELIYKKIDSVLRGNIGVELEAQMKASGKKRALVIPANPLLKRTIKEGIYYVDGKPLMESVFSQDNSFKTKSSNVIEIIKKQGVNQVLNISIDDELPASGLIIGNTISQPDLNRWVQIFNGNTVPSGAAAFFGAILASKTTNQSTYNTDSLNENSKAIFICGSNFPLSRKVVIDARQNGHCVSIMPDEIYYNKKVNQVLVEQWANEIIEMFNTQNQVIVSVLQKPNEQSIASDDIKLTLGSIVKKVMGKILINELLIEGGSTAQAILKEMCFDTFLPIQPLSPGVTRMQIVNKNGVALTMKPGSYEWPKSIWKFDKKYKK